MNVLVLPIDRRQVHHPYSDLPGQTGIQVSTYCFEEVFAEKVRALAERLRPRDLYDVVHLYRRKELNPDLPQLMHALREKCAFKRDRRAGLCKHPGVSADCRTAGLVGADAGASVARVAAV
jgi:predicted nucleotidyltransferase component of viral defense system